MKRVFISLAVVSTLLVGATAFAHGKGGPGHGHHFDRLDQNKDGKVTKAEARAEKTKMFERMDLNKDGAVTSEEAKAAGQAMMKEHGEKRFAEQDKNKDGKLSRDEAKMGKKWFDKIDANQDGFVTKAEIQATFEQRHRGKKKGPGNKMFKHLDTNGDGKLTKQESDAGFERFFQRADKNGDGVITRDEMKKGKRRGPGAEGHGQRKGDKASHESRTPADGPRGVRA